MDRVFQSFFDRYGGTEIVIFILGVIVVVTIVFFLIMQLLNGGERNSSYISNQNKKNSVKKVGLGDDYFNSTKGSNLTKNVKMNINSHQGVSTTPRYNDAKVTTKEDEQCNPINNYREYIQGELEKGVYRESTNEDGTTKREIIFDANCEEPSPIPFKPKYEYLTTANDGKFLKLLPTDEKSFFRTWLANGIRMFEFHGNIDKALANFNAVFDDVCEIIEGKQNGATQIINDEPGTLDNNLKVEKPAKIKLA